MANLCLTTLCNRRCAYCFALGKKATGSAFMSIDTFSRALNFLVRSGIGEARLLGGEPTLHPNFVQMAESALERGLRLLIFTGGEMPRSVRRWLERIRGDRVGLLVNATDARLTVSDLRPLARHVTLGFNIHDPGFQPEFMLRLIREHGFSPAIRFGLAHPRIDGTNEALHPRFYRIVGRRLSEFAQRARDWGVQLEFDCGFVPCMFPPDGPVTDMSAAADIGLRCSPILDLLPDGRFISCFPLAGLHQELLTETETAADLRARFSARLAGRRRLGVFPECSACETRAAERCNGGCLAASLQRLRPAPRKDDTAISTGASWVLPYIDQPVQFWDRLHAEYGRHIKEIYFPLPDSQVGSGRPPQPAVHLNEFLRHSPLRKSVLVNPIVLPGPVAEVAARVIEALRRLTGESGVSSVTISNLSLAARIREQLPALSLTASILMDISRPVQVLMLGDIFDTLVPAGRVMRNLQALRRLRDAFPGRMRLIVNEGCLPGCPHRTQHFYEMTACPQHSQSLCDELLERLPWMRLTGTWVLPQHLHLFEGLCDEWKLSGRVTLRDPSDYFRVVRAYIRAEPLGPHEIGGGPASLHEPFEITGEFYRRTLRCRQRCNSCHYCRDYYAKMSCKAG